eukprot:gene51148-62795_t
MVHFKTMHRARCCGHYICAFCVKDQVRQRLSAQGFAQSVADACAPRQLLPGDGCTPDQLCGVEWCRLPDAQCPPMKTGAEWEELTRKLRPLPPITEPRLPP